MTKATISLSDYLDTARGEEELRDLLTGAFADDIYELFAEAIVGDRRWAHERLDVLAGRIAEALAEPPYSADDEPIDY